MEKVYTFGVRGCFCKRMLPFISTTTGPILMRFSVKGSGWIGARSKKCRYYGDNLPDGAPKKMQDQN